MPAKGAWPKLLRLVVRGAFQNMGQNCAGLRHRVEKKHVMDDFQSRFPRFRPAEAKSDHPL